MAEIRTFIAIPCPPATQEELAALQEQIKSEQPKAKLIFPFNYHITLAYIGQTREEDVEFIKSLLPDWTANPTQVWSIDRLDSFSTHKIIYAAGSHCPAIESLGSIVRRKLRQHGISFDDKPLRPHISLARKATLEKAQKLSTPIQMQILKPELFRSGIRIDDRLTYIKL